MKTVKTEFSELLRAQRAKRKWTLAEIARRSSTTQPEISRVERGLRHPTLRHVYGLAVAFSKSPTKDVEDPTSFKDWLALLAELAVEARTEP
jgi:transcriptional regulator with XRE-family HTH domain